MEKKRMKEIINKFSNLYTPAVSDAIDELGLEPGFLDTSIRPIWSGARMVGFAGTWKMIPSDEPLDRNIIAKMMKYIDKAPKYPVACIDMGGKMIAAGLGQSTCRIMQGFGFMGGLVDGPVRDIVQIISLKFPIFAKGIVCSSIRGRMVVDLDSMMKPVQIGGRTIETGDLIFGDINGVVVVKKEEIGTILEKTREIIATDKWWFEQLEKGRSPMDLEKEKELP